MTTTINLLPWREERRKQRQQEFVEHARHTTRP